MEYSYPLKFGKYLLTRRIAVGGMAEVFKAKLIGPKGFEKTLALKRILPEFGEDEDFVAMFVDEARISSNLHHPNIISVFDFGEVNGSYYMAMEFVDGPNLKNLLQRCLRDRGRFSRDFSLFISLQVASALDYAHNVRVEGREILNLIHRDVSPQNVLVSRTGEVKITDFGIAKATIKMSRTQPGKVQGKLSYMSPEQASGRPVDKRSDIFSLGVILFELFSGVKVYTGDDTAARYTEVREARIPRLASLVPDLPSQLESLIMRMLSRDPEDRPQTCAEIVRELNEIAGNLPLSRIPAQLGSLVGELFPQEKSDSSVGRRVSEFAVGGRTEGEPATEVDLRRIPPPAGSTPPEVTVVGKRTIRPLLLTLLFLATLLFWFRYREEPPHAPPSPPIVSEEGSPSVPLDVTPRSGPADPDIAQAARRRQEEIEALQAELEESLSRQKAIEQALKERDRELERLSEEVAAPRGPCPPDMILVEGGIFLFGSERDDKDRNDLVEQEAGQIPIRRFCIDRYEYPNRKGAMPFTGIRWADAQGTCFKKGKRLCSQEEWERGCKGPTERGDRRYPYGEIWDPLACNTKGEEAEEIAPAGSFERCVTKEGIFDMSGNVEEWTASQGPDPDTHVARGGSSLRPGYQGRCSSVRWIQTTARPPDVGFRCCRDAI